VKTTNIGKVLIVLTLVFSLSFLGFTIATSLSGANWQAEMLDLQGPGEFQGYKFAKANTPPYSWSVSKGEKSLTTSKVPAEVVISALKDATTKQQEETKKFQDQEQKFKGMLDIAKKTQVVDEAALDVRRKELLARYEATRDQGSKLANEVAKKTEEDQKIEQRIAERREDVIRLQSQVGELRTDIFRLKTLRQELEDQQSQLQADLNRAKERNERLQKNTKS
jgi:SMC interacting uncharacterized protein involved in chromosome segregation